MKNWQSDFIETNGIRLHYTRAGGDKPAVVLAHGITDDGLCWGPVADALAPEYDVIMVDARGHGRSDRARDGYGLEALAADLAAMIAGLNLTRPAILGHSVGAATTLVLAAANPEVPAAILLEDPPAWWSGWSETPEAARHLADMRERYEELKTTTREERLTMGRARHPSWSDAEHEPLADAKGRYSPDVFQILESGYPKGVDWPRTLRRIACPALLVTGEPTQGAIVTDESAAALQMLIPHLQIAHVAEAGHSIRRDQFAPYMDVVRRFLREHQGGTVN